MGLGAEPDRYPPKIMDAYRRALDDPPALEAMSEDYRAGACVDIAHDDAGRDAGRQITCPVLVLWAEALGCPASTSMYSMSGARGHPTSAAGRSTPSTKLAEDRPQETAAELLDFLAVTRQADASQRVNAARDTLGG